MAFKIESKSTLFHGTPRVTDYGLTQVNQGSPSGSNFTNDEPALYMLGLTGGKSTDCTPVTVLNVRFMDTLGGGNGEWYASSAFQKMYNAMCGSAYETTDFSKADLAKHIMFGRACLEALALVDRALDTYAINEYINGGIGNLHKAGKLVINSDEDYVQCVASRNELVPLINKLMLPSNIPAVDRSLHLCRHVYADDLHDKTQFIQYIPRVLYCVLLNNTDISTLPEWNGKDEWLVADFLDTFIFHLREYLDSAFFNDFAKYLWRSMLDPAGPKIAVPYSASTYEHINPTLDITIIYDAEVCDMVRNSDYVGDLVNFRNNHEGYYSHVDLIEDDDGILRQGELAYNTDAKAYGLGVVPLYYRIASGTLSSTEKCDTCDANFLARTQFEDVIYPAQYGDRLVNLPDFPSKPESIYSALCNKVMIGKSNSTWKSLYVIKGCGAILCLDIEIWATDSINNNAMNQDEIISRGRKIPYVFNALRLALNTVTTLYSFNSAAFLRLSHFDHELENTFCGVFSMPILWECIFDENDTHHIYVMPKIFDVDNLFYIPSKLLVVYVKYDSYDRFDMNSSTKPVQQPSGDADGKKHERNKRRSGRKRRQNKEKKDGKSKDNKGNDNNKSKDDKENK